MYKMIAFDIDGTLVPHLTNEFSSEINDMFKELKSKGFIVTLATGRDWVSIAQLYKNPNIDYYIGANGSFIYDIKNQKFIFNSYIDWNEFEKYNKEIIEVHKSSIKSVILSDINNVFVLEVVNRNKPWFWNAFRHKFEEYENAENKLDRNNFHLLTIEHKYNSDILEISRKFFEKNNTKMHIQAYWPKGFFVANKGVTKAHSIKKLCDYLSIDIKEVIAFGDGENDMEMIKEVGLGVAMGNSIDTLKELADDVTIDVSEYGTKFYLKKIGII
ncbi:MAG: HAD family hydrolase [Mycoplasma sp.]|nr:HAD family hydrolase [Mycoplasma sp.]